MSSRSPEALLLDEPTSTLKAEFTIAIVARNMRHAAAIADCPGYIFIKPKMKQSED